MSGADRYWLEQELIAAGWTDAPADVDCDSKAHACLVPPQSLWDNRPQAFYVYDARDLQNMLAGHLVVTTSTKPT